MGNDSDTYLQQCCICDKYFNYTLMTYRNGKLFCPKHKLVECEKYINPLVFLYTTALADKSNYRNEETLYYINRNTGKLYCKFRTETDPFSMRPGSVNISGPYDVTYDEFRKKLPENHKNKAIFELLNEDNWSEWLTEHSADL